MLAGALSGAFTDSFQEQLRSLRNRDWLDLIGLANIELVSAELARALLADREVRPLLPGDVKAYFARLLAANAERNRQLARQCLEIGTTAQGRRVVLLKGATWLFDEDVARCDGRMMRDIDLLVAREDAPALLRTLEAAGYRAIEAFDEGMHFHLTPMVHPSKGAPVEIHLDLSHWPALLPAEDVLRRAYPVAPGLWRPASEDRILHNVLHAQKENGDWWGGAIRLRDTLDLKWLVTDLLAADSEGRVLSDRAAALGLHRLVSGAIHVAHRSIASSLPRSFAHDRRGRRHALRCMAQRGLPGGPALEWLGRIARALAWERDAYGLRESDTLALLTMTRQRLRRIGRWLGRAHLKR